MRGMAQDLTLSIGAEVRDLHARDVLAPIESAKVIGVICAGDLAVYRDEIKAALQRGLEQHPDAVWVCIESKSDRMTHGLMVSLGIEPVVLPLVDAWRSRDERAPYDLRRTWRDLEMGSLCDELVIFQKRSGNSPWRKRSEQGAKNLVLVEIGREKKQSKVSKSNVPAHA